jgi:hypothetical protein
MIGSLAVDILMQRLGNRQDTEFRANIVNEMALTQSVTLEGSVLLPWFLLKDTLEAGTSLTWSANTERVAIPTDFVGFDDDLQCGVFLLDSSSTDSDPYIPLARKPYAALKEFSKNTYDSSSDQPYAFDLMNQYFYLRPIQTSARTLRVIYLARDPLSPADNAVENLWLKYASDLLIAETGIVLAQHYTKDPDAVVGFQDQRVIALARLNSRNEAYKHSLQNYTMGD